MKVPKKRHKKEEGKKRGSKDLAGQLWDKDWLIINKIKCEIRFHR